MQPDLRALRIGCQLQTQHFGLENWRALSASQKDIPLFRKDEFEGLCSLRAGHQLPELLCSGDQFFRLTRQASGLR
jgi:hypothetical protein